VKEYTTLALVSAIVIVAADRLTGVRVLSRREFWIFLGVMAGFMLVTNGYLTSRPIVLYNEQFLLNVRLWTIPIEDFFYGFSLIALTIIFWEYFKRKESGGVKR